MDTRERINHLQLDGWKPDQIEFLKAIASMSYKDGFNDGSEGWKSKLDDALQAFAKVYDAKATCNIDDING